MVDVGKELLKQITETFEESVKNSKRLSRLSEVLGTDYEIADQYAKELGNLLAKAIRLHVDADSLPDGKMYYNIGQTILQDRLTRNYKLLVPVLETVQGNLNAASGLGLKPQLPELRKDKIHDLAWRVSEAESYESVADMLQKSVGAFTQSIVADAIEANADFQSRAGLSPYIVRTTDGSCCNWCTMMAGVYKYPCNSEVYQRHQSCTCTITYYPTMGSRKELPKMKARK